MQDLSFGIDRFHQNQLDFSRRTVALLPCRQNKRDLYFAKKVARDGVGSIL
jgi:hypothetical protein